MTEVWKPIPGYEGLYEASSEGRIRSLGRRNGCRNTPRVLRPTFSGKGYAQVSLRTPGVHKRFYVHRLVALAFIGPWREGQQVNHIDGNPRNNASGNLEYVTCAQNLRHSYRKLGRKATHAKLTQVQRKEIQRRFAAGDVSKRQLAREYQVSETIIARLVGRTKGAKGNARLNERQAAEIRRLHQAGGVTMQALADRYGVGHSTVARVVHGTAWKGVGIGDLLVYVPDKEGVQS